MHSTTVDLFRTSSPHVTLRFDADTAVAAETAAVRYLAETGVPGRVAGKTRHEHEAWQVRDDGCGPYCAACGQAFG